MRERIFIFIILAVITFMACTPDVIDLDRGQSSDSFEEEKELCSFDVMFSKSSLEEGDYKDRTYRAQLFYRSNPVDRPRFDKMYSPYSGTYCNPKTSIGFLTPCKVDDVDFGYDDSVAEPESRRYALRAGFNNNYYLILNSPASKYEFLFSRDTTLIQSGTSHPAVFYYWGMPYLRDSRTNGSSVDLPKDHPLISEPVPVTTIGASFSSNYVYSMPETAVLTERRSRMGFSIRCGSAITSAKVKRISITGLRKKAWFLPFSNRFYFNIENTTAQGVYEDEIVIYENTSGLTLQRQGNAESGYSAGKSWSITGLTTAEELVDGTKSNEYLHFILSDDYIIKDAVSSEYINEPPYLKITLMNDEGVEVDVDPVPLALKYLPQTDYFWLVTISKIYVATEVTTVWGEHINQGNEDIDVDNITDGYYGAVHQVGDWMSQIVGGDGDSSINPGAGDPVPGNGSGDVSGWDGTGSLSGDISGDGDTKKDVTGIGAVGDWNPADNDGDASVELTNIVQTGIATQVVGGKMYTLKVADLNKTYTLSCDSGNLVLLYTGSGPVGKEIRNGEATPVLERAEYTIYVKNTGTISLTANTP